jgi:peptidase M1-like protein
MRILALSACLSLWAGVAAGQTPTQPPDGIDRLVLAIEDAAKTGQEIAVRGLARYDIDAGALNDFAAMLTSPPATSVTVKERDRAPLTNGRQRLLLEILTDRNREGRVSTWRVDASPPVEAAGNAATAVWQVAEVERLSVIGGLYRLKLDGAAEYEIRNLVIEAPDLTLSVPSGRAFVARTNDGPTALVVIGRGRMQFAPKPDSERVQVRIFCGADALGADFDALFVRLSPYDFARRVSESALVPRALDGGDLKRATQIFESYLPRSFEVDLSDLSPEPYSLTPSMSDFVAEIVTKKYGALTYARAGSEPEDISFFDRQRHRNIAIYASESKLAQRGRFFSEDDQADYDVTSYEVDAAFSPDRLWIDGIARLKLRTRDSSVTTLTIKLAEPLVVRSVSSPQFGRLLNIRVVRQSSVLVSLPVILAPQSTVELTIRYGGRLEPQMIDREAMALDQERSNPTQSEALVIPPEPSYVYSNNSFWYPQGTVTDYADAKLAISVPSEFDVVATGAPQGPPEPAPVSPVLRRGGKRYVFATRHPVRYLACVISRFNGIEAAQLNLPSPTTDVSGKGSGSSDEVAGDGGGAEPASMLTLSVQANPRQFNRARNFAGRAADILRFYTSLLGDAPYDSFTLALTESDLPGGHSPAYFAILNQPLPTTPYSWRNDPVAFDNYPSFFLAHEVAHQWWGQSVGWKNYHEQWISEGFAQYFAALYAERERGPEQFASVIKQMRRWGMEMSPQGPIYLGYRLGHIKGEGRVFRAIVYNKGAMVLHMLRRLVGDEAFFKGLREFYTTWRYKKAGTEDFRVAMERATGRSLERFFERWVFGNAIPTVTFTSQVEKGGDQLAIRLEQRQADIFDIPVTVTLSYGDGSSTDLVVTLDEKVTERTIPLKGALRNVEVNRDHAALAEIEK